MAGRPKILQGEKPVVKPVGPSNDELIEAAWDLARNAESEQVRGKMIAELFKARGLTDGGLKGDEGPAQDISSILKMMHEKPKRVKAEDIDPIDLAE